jgi:hypothetical protein
MTNVKDVEKLKPTNTCREVKNIWQLFNEFVTNANQNSEKVQDYDNIFKIEDKGNVSKVKMKIVQGLIQVERPKCWTLNKINDIAKEIKWIELYNAKLKI